MGRSETKETDMIRRTRTTSRLAAVLAAAVISLVTVQSAGADPGSVGLARGILETQFGFSPSRAVSWTTGACSYQVKPSSCYLTPAEARSTSVAEASSFGVYRNMTPQQAADWSTGVCSYQDKPSSCYLTPEQAAAQSQALANAMGIDRAVDSTQVQTVASGSFGWGDASIGAAATLGIVLLLAGLGAAIVHRRREQQPTHA
jgi:hypothetical protein